jgi:hypothetical protein
MSSKRFPNVQRLTIREIADKPSQSHNPPRLTIRQVIEPQNSPRLTIKTVTDPIQSQKLNTLSQIADSVQPIKKIPETINRIFIDSIICKKPLCRLPKYLDDFPCSDDIKKYICRGDCNKHHLAKGRYYCDRCALGECPNMNFCIDYINSFNPFREIHHDMKTCPREHDFSKILETSINIPCGPNNPTIISQSDKYELKTSNESNLLLKILGTKSTSIPSEKKIESREIVTCLYHKDKCNHKKPDCLLIKVSHKIEYEGKDKDSFDEINIIKCIDIMSYESVKPYTREDNYWYERLMTDYIDSSNDLARNTLSNRKIITLGIISDYEKLYNKEVQYFEGSIYYNIYIMIDIFKYKKLHDLDNMIYKSINNLYNIIDSILNKKLENIAVIPDNIKERYKLLFQSWYDASGNNLDSLYSCDGLIKLLHIKDIPKPNELLKGVLNVTIPSLSDVAEKDKRNLKNIQKVAFKKTLDNINKFLDKIYKLKTWIINLSLEFENMKFNNRQIKDIVDDTFNKLIKLYDNKNDIDRKIEEQYRNEKNNFTEINELINTFKSNKKSQELEEFKKRFNTTDTNSELNKIFNFDDNSYEGIMIRYLFNNNDFKKIDLLIEPDVLPKISIIKIKKFLNMVKERLINISKLNNNKKQRDDFFEQTNIMNYFIPSANKIEKKVYENRPFSDNGLDVLQKLDKGSYITFLTTNQNGMKIVSDLIFGFKQNNKSRLSLSQLASGIKDTNIILSKIKSGDINNIPYVLHSLSVLFRNNQHIINYLVNDPRNTFENLLKTIKEIERRMNMLNNPNEIYTSLAYNIKIWKVILNFNYNPINPEYNLIEGGQFTNIRIRKYINLFLNSCSKELIEKFMIGGEPEDKIKIRISLDLNRPQLEFSFDEMNFEVSGPILDRFKKVFTPVKKQIYIDESNTVFEIKEDRLFIKDFLELNLNKVANIFNNFREPAQDTFIRFDLYDAPIELDVLKFPTLDSKTKYIKYKNKYLQLKSHIASLINF